jgi:hypothetical protein
MVVGSASTTMVRSSFSGSLMRQWKARKLGSAANVSSTARDDGAGTVRCEGKGVKTGSCSRGACGHGCVNTAV